MNRKIFLTVFLLLFGGVLIHAEDAPQQFQGFDLQGYSKGGQKTWDVKGETADIMGNLIKLTNIVGNAYGDEQVNLTADHGTIDKTSGKMHLQDDVVITAQNGAKLTTDSLDWDRGKDLVTTNDKVKIVREDMTATGTGVIAHPNLKTAQMNEDVTVKVKTEPKKANNQEVTITCDGPMEIDQILGKATFNENVVAVQEGRTLKADKLEMYFDAGTKQIKEMVCTGHVSITQAGNTTFSEKAVYTAADKRLVLSGRPKLILETEKGAGLASFGN